MVAWVTSTSLSVQERHKLAAKTGLLDSSSVRYTLGPLVHGSLLLIIIAIFVALVGRLVSLGLYPLTDPTESTAKGLERRSLWQGSR